MIHGKRRTRVMLDGGKHPTMPPNSCSLVQLGSRLPSGRILLSLQFEFLVPRGHASTVRVARGHIIRATCQAACPFKRLDARAYPLYREAFWVSSLILTSRVVHFSCFLCAPLLSPMILPLPLFSSIVSNSSLLG